LTGIIDPSNHGWGWPPTKLQVPLYLVRWTFPAPISSKVQEKEIWVANAIDYRKNWAQISQAGVL
jgi:hypothetical protein